MPEGEPAAYPIGSVDNALRLLGLLRVHSSITVSQAAEELGVARSTAHRLLGTLRQHGFVRQDEVRKAYLPGRALMEIGLSVVDKLDIRAAARPVLEALSHELGETVHLAVLDGGDSLFVDSIESTATIRVSSRVGAAMPASCTAAGKALLAGLAAGQVRGRLGGKRPRRMTERSVVTWSGLEAELAEVRERGYAVNGGESEGGLSAVAAAIGSRTGPPRASITASVPTVRLDDARVEEIGAAVVAAAEQVSEALLSASTDLEPVGG